MGAGMTGASNEEMSLRAYLLGWVDGEEQRRIEEHLVMDDDYVELLLITEEELIDSYLSDALSEREREAFQNYFLITPARQRKLRMARALRRYINEQTGFKSAEIETLPRKVNWWQTLTPVWRTAIAAMLVIGIGFGIWYAIRPAPLINQGRAALQAALRESPIEGRMAGFDWSPRQVTLGEQPGNIADRTSLAAAERYLLDAAMKNPGPDSYYALGQLYMAKGELDNAIEEFDKAVAGDSKNARLRNDLGAALLERARNSQEKDSASSLQDFDQSLTHLNQAIALDDALLAALFNRALCYQYMQLLSQAEADWRAYLDRDSNSEWADEARRHLKDIEEKKQKASQINTESLQQFLIAFRGRDQNTALRLINENGELLTGRLIWWQLLDDYFSLISSGKLAEANERIRALQYAGELELNSTDDVARQSRDHYLAELGKFYGSLSSQQRVAMAQAHRLMNEGNGFYSGARYNEAISNYAQARETFTRNGNQEEAVLANLLIGYCHIQKSEIEQSRLLFENIVAQCRKENYLWLLAQSSFGLAMVQDREAEYSKALENTQQVLRISKEMSDVYNIQRSLAQVADQYRKLGNYEYASSHMNECLKQVNASWPGDRQMWRNCDQLMQVLIARRLNTAAAAYANEALRLALQIKDTSIIWVSYVHLAMIHARQQDYTEAIRLCKLGLSVAQYAVNSAYASLQLGHLYRQIGDLEQALAYYDQCVKRIDSTKPAEHFESDDREEDKTDRLPALRYDAHKGRLFCLFAQGDSVAAQQELERTLELLEKYRRNIQEEKNRNTFFNVEQSVYDAAINFEHSRLVNNPAVFDYAEESRARSLLEMISPTQEFMRLDEVQRRLPAQTQLIEYSVLDDKLLVCLVSESDYSVKSVNIRSDELTDKVLEFRRLIVQRASDTSSLARELYDLLIKPIDLSTDKGNRICIVPDKILNHLPFAALLSPATGGYLIEDYYLTVSPSATVYLTCTEKTGHKADTNQERLLAVGDPRFDRSAFPGLPALPSTRRQIERIAHLYPSSSVLTEAAAREETVKREMEKADVIHLASHYVVYEGDPMNSRLLLAQESRSRGEDDTSPGVLQADEVYGLKLQHAPLVILSACESGVEHYYNGEGMIGMSRVFIAAGAPIVVASLWQVDAYATDELMINFHRHRRVKRASTSESLRLAQIDMLGNSSKNHPYYWAGFTPIGGQTKF